MHRFETPRLQTAVFQTVITVASGLYLLESARFAKAPPCSLGTMLNGQPAGVGGGVVPR